MKINEKSGLAVEEKRRSRSDQKPTRKYVYTTSTIAFNSKFFCESPSTRSVRYKIPHAEDAQKKKLQEGDNDVDAKGDKFKY